MHCTTKKPFCSAIAGRTAQFHSKYRYISHVSPKPAQNTLNHVWRSFKVTHFKIAEKHTIEGLCVLQCNNVGHKDRNFDGQIGAFPFLRRVSVACYAERCNSCSRSVRRSVRVSVRPSHAGTVSKQLKLRSCGLQRRRRRRLPTFCYVLRFETTCMRCISWVER